MTIGERIRAIRKERKISLAELAETANISRTYLWEIETKAAKTPSVMIVEKIAKALNYSASYVMGFVSPDADIPELLQELALSKGEELDIKEEDLRMLSMLSYRGRKPESIEHWEFIFRAIRMVLQ